MRTERAAVIAERRAATSTAQLVVDHLRKQYAGGKLAVRDLCLRVYEGECFGFLGVNGAGKSTTFSMLTGAVKPTAGDARLAGKSILTQQDEIRRHVGYCPQHDALEGLLNSREQLRLFAAIKGVESQRVEAEVEGLITDLDLVRFAHKPSKTYSGGNKRKLCVAIALIGSPSLVLLDEPSSGMDAASKRFLWSVIRRRTAHASSMLTTHSMEECEALCSRICVMVDGAMRSLGPIMTLKTTYGQGLKVEVRLNAEMLSNTSFFLALQAAGWESASLEEDEPPLLTVILPAVAAAGGLGPLFEFLNDAKRAGKLLEYSVSQTSLEQVFLQLARRRQEKLRSTMSKKDELIDLQHDGVAST